MTLKQRIAEDFKRAMKAKEGTRLSCLRMLRSSLKNSEVEKGRELTDEEIQALVSSLIRKGKEAVEEFRKGNREDLALKEEGEIQVFYEYLPQQLTPQEIEETLGKIISEVSAEGLRDMGKVMKELMPQVQGKADGKLVSQTVARLLG